MAGFQLRQAFWIVLILAHQLPKGLRRLGVVATPPVSNPIDRSLSGGSNAIADFEPTRHENLAPAHLFATREHRDESPDAETEIEQDLTTENRLSPSGQQLSASQGSDASVAPPTATSQRNVETPINSFGSGHIGSSTAKSNIEDGPLPHRQEPGRVAKTEEAPLAASNADRNTHDAGLPTSDSHNSDEVHDLPNSHQPSEETRGQPSVPGPNQYSAGHHQPVPQQALSRLQLHRVTFWEAVIAYRPRVSYAYLPVSYQAAFHPTPQPIADQSHIYAQPLPVTHHAGFDESSGSTLPVMGRRFPGKSPGSSSFPDYQSTRPIPPRYRKKKKERIQPTKDAEQWKAKNGAGRVADLSADAKGVESSSSSNLPASTASTSSGSELHRAPESPKESDSLPIDSSTHMQSDSKTTGSFPNEPSEVLPPNPQALAEMESRGKTNDASETESPPFEGRQQVIDSSKLTMNMPAQDPRATSSELKKELGSALPVNPVKSALSAKPVKASVTAHPGSSQVAATTSSKGGDLEESGRGHQVPSNKQLALPLQLDMPKPRYTPPDYKPQARNLKFLKNHKDNALEARPSSKKTGQSRAVTSLPRHNRFAALENSERTGVQKQESRVAERVLQNEIPQFDGETVEHELDSATSSAESSGSGSDSSKMNADPRKILHPHIASLGSKISRLQSSFPALRLSFSSSPFLQSVLHYVPSFSVRKSLVYFISNYKFKFAQIVARERGHDDHPVPVESQEDLSQAKLAVENKRAKGKALLQTSRLSHGHHPSSSDPAPPEPVKTSPQAEASEGSGSLNESQRSDSGMSTEAVVPSSSSRKQKATRVSLLESKESMPDYLQEYMKLNPGAKARELELVQEAGKLLRAEVVGSYTPVLLDPKRLRLEALDLHLMEAVAGKPMIRQIRWLTHRIGDIEGRRRWKALVRQYNRTRILLLWSELAPKISRGDLARSAKILKLGESWPTFQDVSSKDHSFAEKVIMHRPVVEEMYKILGRGELLYRLQSIYFMSGRRYPHNWLSTEDMITTYQQGLNTNHILLVGDYLQFGRDYLSVVGQAGVAPEGATCAYLNVLLKAISPGPWGTSAEKTWLLSDPHRAQLYTERFNRLKHRWKYHQMTPEEIIDDVPEIAEAIRRNKLKSKVWWNLADMIEWQEYHLPSNTMAFIGFELGIPQERNVPVDLARLKKILENKPLAKHMKQIIETWFQDHAFSPYDNLPELHPSEVMTSWADLKTNLAVCWKQKTLYPQHQPLFLSSLD